MSAVRELAKSLREYNWMADRGLLDDDMPRQNVLEQQITQALRQIVGKCWTHNPEDTKCH